MTTLQALLQRATVRQSGPWGQLTDGQERVGVMIHYTAGTDLSGLQWLLFDSRCKVSYNWLILDDATVVTVAPRDARAYHAGVCRPDGLVLPYRDANSAFYGLAISAEPGERVTDAAFACVTQLTVALFRSHGWPANDVPFRLTDHEAQAWPRGRKHDTGDVLPLDALQRAVAASLLAREVAA